MACATVSRNFSACRASSVRVVYMDGPQVYGRTAADDVGFEAAFLARELGRPVRVQWMRDEETAWDTKGPAYTFKLRGGLAADGTVVALDYDARAADYNHLGYNEADTVLIAQLMGRRPKTTPAGGAATPSVLYAIPNQRMQGRVVSLPQIWETPLRTGNLRDPNGPQVTFAFESFIDELAATAGADPVQFRLDMVAAHPEDEIFRRARSLATIRAAAETYGWDTRPSPQPRARRNGGSVLTGRGIAYTYRNNTVVATIAEVEVSLETGRVWVKRLVCAHDCGLVINPNGLRHTIENGCIARIEPGALGRGAVRHREGHERRLGHAPEPKAFGHAGTHRRGARQRRPEPEPPRSAALWGWRGEPQARDRRRRQCNPRRHRRPVAQAAFPQGARAGGAAGSERIG